MRSKALVILFSVVLLGAPIGAAADDLSSFWEDLKLRLSPLQKFFFNQEQELEDLRERSIDPEQHTRIDLSLLRDGGPPKDGIPSIDQPKFDTAKTTPFGPDELVVAVEINGDARAYPYGIMNWHEVVNDVIGGLPVTVSYCPLCDTMLVHERGETTFGVSGKLFQSCLVMYDRADDTLYAQPWGIGIIGPNVNRRLKRYPVVKTTLGKWLAAHPDSKILGTDTGRSRDYFEYPYGSYTTNRTLIFPVRNQRQLVLHPKEIISYVWTPSDNAHPRNKFAGARAAVQHDWVRRVGEVEVPYGYRRAVARWDPQLGTVKFQTKDGTGLISSTAFAFVYPAFFGESIRSDSIVENRETK